MKKGDKEVTFRRCSMCNSVLDEDMDNVIYPVIMEELNCSREVAEKIFLESMREREN